MPSLKPKWRNCGKGFFIVRRLDSGLLWNVSAFISVGFWMSDKPIVQQALAGELAELVLTITDTPSSLAFLGAFWETTVREWSGIDRLRFVFGVISTQKAHNCSG
jgi:hypothetical protein